LVEMIKGLPGCKGAASEVSRVTMTEGHDINAVSVFVHRGAGRQEQISD